MKLLLLADSNSSHTRKWAISLAERSIHVYIFTLSECQNDKLYDIENIKVINNGQTVSNGSSYLKIRYLAVLKRLKKLINEIKPDIVHAHYASSYGLLGALSGFHPLITSMWGSDIFEFPRKSFLHKSIIKYNLSKADLILSTSKAMMKEAGKYSSRKILHTPFGIDLNKFVPDVKQSDENKIVVGTIKALEHIYGIDILIRAFAVLTNKYDHLKLRLLLVGKGSQMPALKNLCKELNIEALVHFAGHVTYDNIVSYYHQIDVFVAVSRNESFGVSVLEASACEIPVVVSDIGGLPEVVIHNETGLIVQGMNVNETSEAIERLINDKQLRIEMGKKGRQWVEAQYDWNNNVNQMLDIYEQILKKRTS